MVQLARTAKRVCAGLRLKKILDSIDPSSIPMELSDVPEYPQSNTEINYLTIVPDVNNDNTTYDATSEYELTVYIRHCLNDDKAKEAAVRDLFREQRFHYVYLRISVFETIDKFNKVHLQSCINNHDTAPIFITKFLFSRTNMNS